MALPRRPTMMPQPNNGMRYPQPVAQQPSDPRMTWQMGMPQQAQQAQQWGQQPTNRFAMPVAPGNYEQPQMGRGMNSLSSLIQPNRMRPMARGR